MHRLGEYVAILHQGWQSGQGDGSGGPAAGQGDGSGGPAADNTDIVIATSLGADAPDPVITAVSYDSRDVQPGTLFICKGVHFDPAYLLQAAERGASAYVSETVYPESDLPWIQVSDIREAIARAGTLFYDRDWAGLTVVGITGTKGKTTTTSYVHAMLAVWLAREGRPAPGLVTSIRNQDGVVDIEAVRTTPETLALYQHLHNAAASGLTHFCLEVSSQGLRYRRVANIDFAVGCFLNVSEDHISPHEHPDYEDYLSAKLEIFGQSRVAVVNLNTQDRERVLAAAAQCEKVVTFEVREGTEGEDESAPTADLVGFDVTATPTGSEFSVQMYGRTERFSIGMPGVFNVENALAAIAIASCLGVPVDCMREGLAGIRVPGRMEVYQLPRGTRIIVDYAHQRLSVETLFASVRHDYPTAPVSVVFGSGGEKAWNRRAEMGTLAASHADEIYLTEEDPGRIPVVEICEEIDSYVQAAGHKPSHIHPDRREAIERAVAEAPDDGLVLVIGKGAERWQFRGTTVEVPSDIDMVQDLLARQ